MAHHPRSSPLIIARAREMRSAMTETEEILWHELSGGRLGVAFRRQVPIGRYVADFAALSVKLVVEVDGGYHSLRGAADARRDRDLARWGFRVLHVGADEVRAEVDRVVDRARRVLQGTSTR
ncbi:MAG: DUF559 domain-containing protein [Myxococcales bacterium]|nr:DUF559 domain-containing protein [Myxococcales bacterium]